MRKGCGELEGCRKTPLWRPRARSGRRAQNPGYPLAWMSLSPPAMPYVAGQASMRVDTTCITASPLWARQRDDLAPVNGCRAAPDCGPPRAGARARMRGSSVQARRGNAPAARRRYVRSIAFTMKIPMLPRIATTCVRENGSFSHEKYGTRGCQHPKNPASNGPIADSVRSPVYS